MQVCSRRDCDSIYVFSTIFCVLMRYSRLDYEICQGLVEILCVGLRVLWGAVGLDNLRILCYTGKGCYKVTHLSAFYKYFISILSVFPRLSYFSTGFPQVGTKFQHIFICILSHNTQNESFFITYNTITITYNK